MIRALFPLPVFLLPGGYTKLRIFEPRYLTMVGNALKRDEGFVLCPHVENAYLNVPSEGMYVRIVDFSQDKGGQLLIDVAAQHRVTIADPFQDEQNLRHATISIIEQPVWCDVEPSQSDFAGEMADMLSDVFVQNPEIDALYREKHFDDPVWVASRWLELLPMKDAEKHKLKSSVNFEQVVNFLHTILYKSQ
ncbi:peptidase S16 [Pseudoalteromonas sp. A25]|uniref:LON peptidase substrate-binding domain-containing protein n=1 Tax=Pseudoalteromonas sp. A25 TaxID=116092 RepID=UPI0012612BC0|nr:LON peptidase substrate-binding domain-containing protein [Pseudoalteromonas sp. A25]BBN83294.1 peptidase S16 [Pseudoalteromonas sp. A25]